MDYIVKGVNMTQYIEAKEYFKYLSTLGVDEAKHTMRLYKKMKKRRGDFLAARFILEVYQKMNKDLEKGKQNGKKIQ
ncbi:uncharacterized protein METZ01_LOCUS58538 [marine metagenome]|uniref:Uncharacterized protein n=1 Tax=marine metagenome TaxID=408172 RepID=A0A381SQJ8_9ZZZZ